MQELYKRLISSEIYKKWKSKHPDSFLCSYIIIENPQFDFYNKNGSITSFFMKNIIEIKENQEVFKKNELKPLNQDKVRLSNEQVIGIIKKKYPEEEFTKKIIILQNPGKLIWNITMITSSLKILNIKIGMNKKIISETFEPLTKFMKKVK